jgi:hypothetical protein
LPCLEIWHGCKTFSTSVKSPKFQTDPLPAAGMRACADGGAARRPGQNRGGGERRGYAASLGQRKRGAHIPTAAKEAAGSGLILFYFILSHFLGRISWANQYPLRLKMLPYPFAIIPPCLNSGPAHSRRAHRRSAAELLRPAPGPVLPCAIGA